MTATKVLTWGFLLLCVYTSCSSADQIEQESRRQILRTILDDTVYDKTLRPYSTDTEYVLVKTNLYIRTLTNVEHKDHLYNLGLTLRQEWNDARLTFDDHEGKIPYLTLPTADKIWVPDLFFSNSLKEHFFDVPVPNSFIRIFPNGHVLYSIRVAVKVALDIDTLKLPLRMASYGYNSHDIVFQWREENPVQISPSLQHCDRFPLDIADTTHCNSTTITGEYSCLLVELGSSLTNERHNKVGARVLERQDEILRTILDPDNYNHKVRPVGTNGSQIVIDADAYILTLKEVDEEDKEVTIVTYIRQAWTDPRLKYDDHEGQVTEITLPDPEEIWKPDLFFPDSLKALRYDVTVPNSFARITPDGHVLFSQRIAVKLPCTHNSSSGEIDHDLHCNFRWESYGFSKKDILFRWNPSKPIPVEYDGNVVRNHYKLSDVATQESEVILSTGAYSVLRVILTLHKV